MSGAFTVLGWIFLAGAAISLIAWLRGDKSRGRPRCPRCWYSMEGVGAMSCPECGGTIAARERLYLTKRRGRLIVCAALCTVSSAASLGIAAWNRGWQSMPGAMLVLKAPRRIDDPALNLEMERRYLPVRDRTRDEAIGVINMPRWQQSLLASGLKATLRDDAETKPLKRFACWWWLKVLGEGAGDCTSELCRSLESTDSGERIMAADAAGRVSSRAEEVVPLLVSYAEELFAQGNEDWWTVADSIGSFGARAAFAAPALREMAKRENSEGALAPILQKLGVP